MFCSCCCYFSHHTQLQDCVCICWYLGLYGNKMEDVHRSETYFPILSVILSHILMPKHDTKHSMEKYSLSIALRHNSFLWTVSMGLIFLFDSKIQSQTSHLWHIWYSGHLKLKFHFTSAVRLNISAIITAEVNLFGWLESRRQMPFSVTRSNCLIASERRVFFCFCLKGKLQDDLISLVTVQPVLTVYSSV